VTRASLEKRALAESVGTFVLVLVGAGSVVADVLSGGALGDVGVALAFGVAVAAMVFAFGRVSGAHINPAVTVGLWSVGRFPGREVPLYVSAQCAGGIAAALVLLAATGRVARAAATVPRVSVTEALATEFLLSFVLMGAIASVALREATSRRAAALAIGAAVGLDAYLGGPATGASMNPARSLGPAIASGVWTEHWVYWVAPIAGMTAAILGFEAVMRLANVDPIPLPNQRVGLSAASASEMPNGCSAEEQR
jgi:aquaporin Z